MGIVYSLVILSLAAIYLVLKIDGLHDYLWLGAIYGWIPGILGLVWSRISKIKISFFPKIDRYFWLSLLGGFFVGALTFFIGLLFSHVDIHEMLGKKIILYFFSYYVLFLFVFFVSFLGGEICWRGYLWEAWKNHPYKGSIAIWLLWSLWLVPVTMILSKSLIEMVLYNLALMPVLHFFRKKSQSIGPGTLFFASLSASLIYFNMLLPSSQNDHLLILVSILLMVAGIFVLLSWKLRHQKT